MQCKVGTVTGTLNALQQLFPETVSIAAVLEYVPTLLLSNIQKVALLKPTSIASYELYVAIVMQVLC